MFWRRRAAAVVALLLAVVLVAAVVALATGGDDADTASAGGDGRAGGAAAQAPQPPPPPELPRGGRKIFPDHRVVAFYGAPQADELGILGIGTLSTATRKLEEQAKPYNFKSRPVLPALELIAVIATAAPGEDGKYRARQTNAVIRRHLRAARKAKALLLLDIQPGQANFFTETVKLRRWLREPDVGLAIDPEWRMQPGQLPGQVIGSVTSREVNATSAWLDKLVKQRNLPQKLFVIHQFTDDMVDDTKLKDRDGLAMVLNADGFGGQQLKTDRYHLFTRSPRKFFFEGFKLFYKEDTDLMTPKQVLRLRPRPDFIVYE